MRRGGESLDPEQGSGAVLRAKFRPARGLVASVRPEPRAEVPRPSRSRAERLARQLALAHWIERAVQDGRVASYGEVARALGLTESRITQVTALLGLAPAVQEAVLLGEGGGRDQGGDPEGEGGGVGRSPIARMSLAARCREEEGPGGGEAPRTAEPQVFRDVPLDAHLVVRKGGPEFTRRERGSFRF